MKTICIIGYGYWGKILHKKFLLSSHFFVKYICDRHIDNEPHAKLIQNNIIFLLNPASAFLDKTVDLIVIATQPAHHFSLCQSAINANKDVFVEKPFTLQSDHAKKLYCLAEKKQKKIWVDHTFLFSNVYHTFKSCIQNNKLGRITRWHSTRSLVGGKTKSVNVIWDLFVHDLYILLDLFGVPTQFNIMHHVDTNNHDNVNSCIVWLVFGNGLHASIQCDRLFPVKKREIIVAGEQATLIWDEMNQHKLQLFMHNEQPLSINTQFLQSYEKRRLLSYAEHDTLLNELDALAVFLYQDQSLFFPEQNISITIIQLLEKIAVQTQVSNCVSK